MTVQTEVRPLPFFFVGKDLTNERVRDYANHKHNILSNAIGKPDTKSIWYSKEHIVKLLEEIEYAGGDGVRISFGMYEPSHEFAGQLCLVMNSTRKKIVGEAIFHQTVIVENEPNFAGRDTLPRESLFGLQADPFDTGGRDFNFGSPCPPRCDDFDDEG